MKKHHLLSLTLFSLITVTSLFLLFKALSAPQLVASQDSDDPQVASPSSAEESSETSSEPAGSPNNPAAVESDTTVAGGELISWRITGSALRPRENDVSYTVSANGSCSYVTAGDAFTVWNTPVTLPQGSFIDTLRMYYYDTSSSSSTAWFTVYDLYGSIVDEWSVSTSTAGGNSFNDTEVISHTVDYSTYSYLINWRPIDSGSDMQLCGFRLFYDPPGFSAAFMPMIKK
jgi:hypothetical protein